MQLNNKFSDLANGDAIMLSIAEAPPTFGLNRIFQTCPIEHIVAQTTGGGWNPTIIAEMVRLYPTTTETDLLTLYRLAESNINFGVKSTEEHLQTLRQRYRLTNDAEEPIDSLI